MVVAAGEQRPTAADVSGWWSAARAAGWARLEVLAWEFDPSAHDVDAPGVTLWQIPRALAEGEESPPRRAPRLSLAVEVTPEGRTVRLVDYAAPDGDGRDGWASLGVEAIVEWAIDDRGDPSLFVPRWSAPRGRDGALELRSPPVAADRAIRVEAVDLAGRLSTRWIR